MLPTAILAALNVFQTNKDTLQDLEKVKSDISAHLKDRKVRKGNLKTWKSTKKIIDVCDGIDTKRNSFEMTSKVWVHFGSKITLLVGLICIGCYAADIRNAHNSDIRDFSLLKDVLKASTLGACETEKAVAANGATRKKRGVEPVDDAADDLETPPCLDEMDPIYYVSTYHRAVCKSTVNLAYDVFYEREPNKTEFESWFERCVSREIDEAYMMWKFAESDAHLKLLQVKRQEKLENEKKETKSFEDEDDISVPLKLRMPNEEFTEDLKDPESEEFQELSDDFSEALVDLLADDMPGLKGVKVLGFGNGSLIVYYELIFDDDVKTVAKLYDDEANDEQTEAVGEAKLFDPEMFAEKIKDKVKDVIKEALTNSNDRKGKLNNTILSDNHVDLESLETIPKNVVEEFVKINPSASIVTVDLTTHHDDSKNQNDDYQQVTIEPTEPASHHELDNTHDQELQGSIESEEEEEEEDVQEYLTAVDEKIANENKSDVEIIDDTFDNGEMSGSNAEELTAPKEINVTAAAYNTDINPTDEAHEKPEIENATDKAAVEVIGDTHLVPPTPTDDADAEYLDSLDDDWDLYDYQYHDDVAETEYVSSSETVVVETDVITTTATPTVTEALAATTEEHLVYHGATDSGNVVVTEGDVMKDNSVTKVDSDTVAQVTSPADVVTMQTTPENAQNSTEGAHIEDSVATVLSNETLDAMMSQTVVMKLRVTNMNYTQNLTDRQSEEFQRLEAKFTQMLSPLLQNMNGFLSMEVVGFSIGSLIVNNELHFDGHAPNNVKEDVKQRIDAAAGYFKYAHVDVDPDATEVLRAEEADLCEFVQCHLYSDCVVRTDYRTECICRPGYVSIDPANCVSLCDLEPGYCRNGGECHVVPGRGAVCRCKVNFNWGYQGERCEESMPRSVLLVSASTGVACVTFMLLVALTAYFFYRRKRNTTAQRKKLEDKDFMRAAQIMSLEVKSDPRRIQRTNPMFVREDEAQTTSSGTDPKEISTSISPSPKTSSSSLSKSNGSTSTSSFFVREQLDHNGPLREDMNTPERKLLRIQAQRYPDHKSTWCEENHEDRKREHKKKRERRYRRDQSTAEFQ